MESEIPQNIQCDDPTKYFSKYLPCIRPQIQLPADESISDLNDDDIILVEEDDMEDKEPKDNEEKSDDKKKKEKYEKMGIKIIEGTRVSNTQLWPYCAHGFIIAKDNDNPKKYHKGSGVLIGANFVLTAAHVIRDRKNRDREHIWFIPAATDERFPYGKIPVKRAICAKKYLRVDSEIASRESDYGLLVLAQPVGNATGWLGLAVAKDIVMKTPIFNAGYPGFKCKKNHYEMVTGTGKVMKQKAGYCSYTVTVVKGQSGSGCSVELADQKYYCTGVITMSKGQISKFLLITQSKYSEYLQWMKLFVYTVPLYKKIPDWVEGFKALEAKWVKSLQKKASQNQLSQKVSLKYEATHPKTFLLLQAIPLIKPKVLVLKNPTRDLIELLSVYFPKSITKLMVKGKILPKSLSELLHQASKARTHNDEKNEGKRIEVEKIALPLDAILMKKEKEDKNAPKSADKSGEKIEKEDDEKVENENNPDEKDPDNKDPWKTMIKKGNELTQALPILQFNELIIYDCKNLTEIDKAIIASHVPSTYQEVYFENDNDPINQKSLKISDPKILKGLKYGNWSRLESLDISNTPLDASNVEYLHKIRMPNLKSLNLKNCNLNDACIKGLVKEIWFSLESLDISLNNQIANVGIINLTNQKWPSLKELDISNIPLKKESIHHLAQAGWNKLESLNLSGTNLDDVIAIELAQNQWRKLLKLNLSSIVLTQELMTELVRADWLHQIEVLDLCNCFLQMEAVKIFVSRDYRNLTKLILNNNELGDVGAEVLALGEFSSLSELHLDGNGITAIGAKALSFGKWPLLSYLDMSNNKIGDDGVRDIVEHFYKSLNRLDLNGVGLTNVGAEVVGTQQWRRLSVLKINNNEVTDDGIKSFVKSNISNLEITGNKLGELTMKHLVLRKMPQFLDFKK